MPEFKVFFEGYESVTIKVDAKDYDEAIEKAYDDLPSGLCGQCSGWSQSWTREVSTDYDSPELSEVTLGGEAVYSEDTIHERLSKQVEKLTARIAELEE